MSKKTGTYWRGCTSVPKGADQATLERMASNKAQRLLALLWDCRWHRAGGLLKVAGHRFGAAVHILRQAGWEIETECVDVERNVWRYKLVSRKPMAPRMARVRLYIPWADAEAITHGILTDTVKAAAEEAVG